MSSRMKGTVFGEDGTRVGEIVHMSVDGGPFQLYEFEGKGSFKMSNVHYNRTLHEQLVNPYNFPTIPYNVRTPGPWVWCALEENYETGTKTHSPF